MTAESGELPAVLRMVAGSHVSMLAALPVNSASRDLVGMLIILLTRHFIGAPAAASGVRGLSVRPSPVSKTAPIEYTMSSGLSVSPPARCRATRSRPDAPTSRRGLAGKQSPLAFHAPAVAAKVAVVPDHAVTGDRDGKRVSGARARDRSRGFR